MRPPFIILCALVATWVRPAAAQQPHVGPHAQVLDRIVAVVGSVPILLSQVEEQFLLAQSQGAKVPNDSGARMAARRALLEQMIDEELMVQEAQRDTSIKVTDQEIDDEVNKTVDNVRKQFSSQEEFLTQLRTAGFSTEDDWRRWLGDTQRRTILQQRLIETLKQTKKLRSIPPTDAQLKEFWDRDSTQRPKHPPLISYRQIVMAVKPDSVALARALALADSLMEALRHGAPFGETAKRFSADSETRSQGGELGWFRRGVMVKPFEDVAFRLKPGDISDVVPTQFGFHIIQVERAEPAEVQARHVLIQPEIMPAQVVLTRHLADSVHDALASGAPFDTLAKRYGDPSEPRLVETLPVPQLPAEYQATLGTDTTLGVKAPFEIGKNSGRPKIVVVEVTKWEAGGELSFADVRDRLRDQLGEQLAVKQYLDRMRRTTFIDIRL
ncbi:MAG TPA: peptidylprolyl isomerase [Gemmatimonadales bacterium]|nr:peptidylprolyl isomerase [Gemmatimonadales bacterium]